MKTFSAKPLEVERKWYVVDAQGQTLGRSQSRLKLKENGMLLTLKVKHLVV